MWRRLLVLTGLAALVAYVLRRRPAATPPVHDVDPSDELRRKLDETRSRADAEAADLTDDLDARRREVHERGRAAADEMRGWSE
jgi:hypothetical protein